MKGQEVDGNTIYEVSGSEFWLGLLQLVDGDAGEANRLFREYQLAVGDEITRAKVAKSAGKSKEQIAFDRIRRREERRHYREMRRNLNKAKIHKPKNTAAHHIVPVFDDRGAIARQILHEFGIDIDSAINGVYLPRFIKNIPHPQMKKSYAHSVVHTKMYYTNVTTLLLDESKVPGVTKEDIIEILREIAQDLHNGVFPLERPLA